MIYIWIHREIPVSPKFGLCFIYWSLRAVGIFNTIIIISYIMHVHQQRPSLRSNYSSDSLLGIAALSPQSYQPLQTNTRPSVILAPIGILPSIPSSSLSTPTSLLLTKFDSLGVHHCNHPHQVLHQDYYLMMEHHAGLSCFGSCTSSYLANERLSS